MTTERHAKKTATMAATMKETTGRSVPEWVALLRSEGPPNDREWHTWLKSKHDLGHFRARLIVSEARKT